MITPTLPAWGAAVGTTVEGAAKCNSGTCTLISSYFPRQLFDNPSHIGEGQGIFGTTVTPGSGTVGYPFHQIDFRFSGP